MRGENSHGLERGTLRSGTDSLHIPGRAFCIRVRRRALLSPICGAGGSRGIMRSGNGWLKAASLIGLAVIAAILIGRWVAGSEDHRMAASPPAPQEKTRVWRPGANAQ